MIKIIIGSLLSTVIASAGTTVDTFGILKMYPTKAGTREWNSAHWNNGIARIFKYAPDTCDPTGWTDDHSSGSDGFRVDGHGMMEMSGSGPRFHVNSLLTSKVAAQKFCNAEFTAYYRRKGTQGANWGGMVVGLRSGPLGHASPGGNDCDATTYYGRFRDDGKWDFEKELKHPGSTYWSGSGYNTQDPLWHGATLPLNRWIGMKYIAVNIQNNTQVRLQLFIDSVSNGNPLNGGHWEKVGEVVDAGNWPSGNVSGCAFTNTMVITEGGGTMLLRTDNDTADYKLVSFREIDPSAIAAIKSVSGQIVSKKSYSILRTACGFDIKRENAASGVMRIELFDLRGRIILEARELSAGEILQIKMPGPGIFVLAVNKGQSIKLHF